MTLIQPKNKPHKTVAKKAPPANKPRIHPILAHPTVNRIMAEEVDRIMAEEVEDLLETDLGNITLPLYYNQKQSPSSATH